jgi:hypothetical protein
LLIERNAQRVGKLEIAGTLRIFLQPLLGLQFIGGHSDPFDGEVASRRVFECQQGQQMVKIGARAISPQQGSGQRDFMRVGGEPLFVELVDGDDGWRCIEEVVGHVRELLRLVRDRG